MINRRYSVKKKLGQGRSSVYLCEDSEQSGKKFALKILSANSSIEEQKIFKDEFQTIQKLDHPNIIQAYERGTVVEVSDNEPISIGSKYLAMEYFDGNELLSYHVSDENSLKEIIAQICSVLFYLHQSNYIYYDLKPENILVSEINKKPVIKLIDLGFARSRTEENYNVTGTAEYLAPEILKKEPHDHRVDLYSFGILLYRLIYKKFPFQSQDQLEIYKEHIEKEFNFPESKFSAELINVVKKLLSKDPEERYFNSVQILYDLSIPITEELYQYWVPVKAFSDRTDILNIVNRYVTTPSLGEIIVIRGFEKSGKSAVSHELYSRYENFIFLGNDRTKSGTQLIKVFLNKLLFNEFIFPKLPADTLELADKIFSNESSNLVNDLKLIVNKASQLSRFILLLDDFNMYDNFSLEIFKEIFPIFQVNGCNVILTEKSDLDYVTGFINNLIELNLSSFTTAQTEELLEKTYAEFFPVKDVKELVMQYADFLPGNIIEFLKDIVILRIIQFEYDGIKVISGENADKILKNLFQEIYRIRYESLTKEEIKIAELLSSFEIVPEKKNLAELTDLSEERFTRIVEELQRKHIFQSQSQTGLVFSSDGIKNFIYSKITDKKKHHERIAKTIRQKFPQFSKVELARQFQICENFDESYSLLMSEAEEAEKISALKYKQNILEQLLKLPLNREQELEVKFKLCSLYHLLNIYKNAYDLVEELLKETLDEDEKNDLLIIKGNSLLKLGEVDEGKEVLKTLLPSIKEENKKIKVMLDIAWSEFETNNYEVAANIGNRVISNSLAQSEYKGDGYNLLGSIDFYQKDDLHSALLYFEKSLKEYSIANLTHRIAAIEINIGNMCNILGDYEKVEEHWNKSLKISSSMGNYYQQGKVLLNFGGFHFHNLNFEVAIENYRKAGIIFNSIGDQYDRGLTESNLGEVYLFICEYQNAIDVLKNATEVFHKIQNLLEQSEALFLLAKVYSKIGDYVQFDKTIEELNNLTSLHTGSERIKLHMDFLKSITRSEISKDITPDDLYRVANEYISREERINYFETMTLLVNYYLHQGESSKAFELLSDKNFTEICNSNIYLEIEKLYLIGKTASENSVLYPEAPVFYFSEAYNLMSDLNVNETTCKLIFELSNYYFERGNVLKAKEYASYGKSLINLMAGQFKDERLKDIYLSSSYRKSAWEKFDEILSGD
jgi:serine/threonine protein kinase/Tfp pilus assembly protein PilF